ncbi:MAG TPA: hypothetical protein VFZ20_02145 [Longimicrobium sp.]|nr:hypothetical protein [Longimicrobium sp.]
MISPRRLRILLVLAAVPAAVSPVTFSPERGLVPATACADGTCCYEEKSLCFINGVRVADAYMNGSAGSCAVQQT